MCKLEKKRSVVLHSVIFSAVILLCAVFVNSHDDYFVPESGTSFTGSVIYALTMGNGRYIGNILGTYLPVRYLPNLITRSLILFALIVLTASIGFGGSSPTRGFSLSLSLLTAAVLLIFPGLGIYTQAYQWGHGFYNYVPPVVLLLAGVKLSKRSDLSIFCCLMLIAIGISQSLFAENVTVAADVVAVLMIVDAALHKRERKGPILYSIGSILGTAIMFIVPKLSGLGGSLDWYRGVIRFTDSSFISRVADNLIQIARVASEWHIMFVAMFSLLLIRQRRLRRPYGWMLLGIMGISFAVSAIFNEKTPHYNYLYPPLVVLISALLVLTISSFVLVCLLFSKEVLAAQLVPFLGACVSVAELLFVQPIGARCLFVTYSLLSLTVIQLWKRELVCSENIQKTFLKASTVLIVIVYFTLLPMQAADFVASQARVDSIKKQIEAGETDIYVQHLPFPRIVYKADLLGFYGYTFNDGDPYSLNYIFQSEGEEEQVVISP